MPYAGEARARSSTIRFFSTADAAKAYRRTLTPASVHVVVPDAVRGWYCVPARALPRLLRAGIVPPFRRGDLATPRRVHVLPATKEEPGAIGHRLGVVVKATHPEERVALAEVYPPFDLDAHAEFMLPEDVRDLAYGFLPSLIRLGDPRIDLWHDERTGRAEVVESFLARFAFRRVPLLLTTAFLLCLFALLVAWGGGAA